MNEQILFSQHRPIRTAQIATGWTPELVVEKFLPAAKAHFSPLDKSSDVFAWDPY
jgi:hypothetical protein